MSRRKFTPHPAPVRNPHDEPFWEAAAGGVLLIKHCRACDRPHWYPRPHCPFCGSGETEWREAQGTGEIYSFSIVGGAKRPTAVAIVELDEGPRLTTVLVDADVHGMRIGDRVTVRFEPAEDDSRVPVFTTVAAEEARAYASTTLAEAQQPPDLPEYAGPRLEKVSVVGAGSMGTGIAKAFLAGGLAVVVIDPNGEARERAQEELANYRARLEGERGGWQAPEVVVTEGLSAAADSDLVVEAVFEDMDLKQQIFAELDRVVKPGGILATNTSTLDVNVLAEGTGRPGSVLGMHFFSPAHVMRLVEIVRADATAPETLAAVMAVARDMGKTPVVVGVCPGFAANRMMMARNAEAQVLLIEGALPEQVDRVSRVMGLPMGPFEMLDMAGGIEVNVHRRRATGEENWLIDQLFAKGRLGQKSGQGFYRYEPGKRRPLPDPEVTGLVEESSARAGVQRRRIPDDEIRARLERTLADEGRAILDGGIVDREGDLDVIWRLGFG